MKLEKKIRFLLIIFALIAGIYSLFITPFLTPFLLGGVIVNGILGGFSGKVGPVVGGKWKDIDYMRSYVIPANPNTVDQQTVRTKFGKLVQLARGLLTSLLQPYWDPYYTSMSGFNKFISLNYNTLDGSNDLQATSIISKGTLENLHNATATYDTADGDIVVTFNGIVSGNGLLTDNVACVAYDKNLETFMCDFGSNTRGDGSYLFTWLAGKTATNVIVWVFAFRGTGVDMVISDSIGDVCAAP
jgi:hypothetical protein